MQVLNQAAWSCSSLLTQDCHVDFQTVICFSHQITWGIVLGKLVQAYKSRLVVVKQYVEGHMGRQRRQSISERGIVEIEMALDLFSFSQDFGVCRSRKHLTSGHAAVSRSPVLDRITVVSTLLDGCGTDNPAYYQP